MWLRILTDSDFDAFAEPLLRGIKYAKCELIRYDTSCTLKVIHFFHSDERPELNLENDYPNKTGHNLKTNSTISIL